MITINDCADFIIVKTTADGHGLNLLKLQKLCFYAQAWHLAIENDQLFDGRFEAWVHGPVNRALYKRFRDTHSLYASVTEKDLSANFRDRDFPDAASNHIEMVLETYAGLSGTQLEELTHREEPWLRARGGLPPNARCEAEIDEGLMKTYYRARLQQ
jgi:uncharacterized phage-associated protein